MVEVNRLFRKRIGFPEKEIVTFARLSEILEKTAKTIPFENMCIISNKTAEITKETLIHKVLKRNEGGLCYELNSIFYLFLVENGFHVSLVRGAVYDHISQNWARTGRTHVTILLQHQEKQYIIDTGFGGNLPLQPVPLDGGVIVSETGEFRIKKGDSDFGNYCLEMKLKYKDNDWRLGYAFDTHKKVQELSELNEVKKIISESEHSLFNKAPLLTRITDGGNITLTDTSFTEWKGGKMVKEHINQPRFAELAKHHFSIDMNE